MPLIPAAPPKTATKVTPAARTKAAAQNLLEREAAQKTAVMTAFQGGAGVLAFFKQNADAVAVMTVAEPLADGFVEYARGRESIQRWLNSAGDAAPLMKLAQPIMQLTFQLMANHGMVNPDSVSQFGVTNPKVLELQLKDAQNQQYAQAVQEEAYSREEAKRWAAEQARMEAQDKADADAKAASEVQWAEDIGKPYDMD